MNKQIKHLELFAGIGGFRRAIDLFCENNKLTSECIGFSEIDKYASRIVFQSIENKSTSSLFIIVVS